MSGITDITAPVAAKYRGNAPQPTIASVVWLATGAIIAVMTAAGALVTSSITLVSAADSIPGQAAGFGEVSGCVRLEDGRFVAGANVQLLLARPGQPTSVYQRGALTDQKGCFAFGHLPAGSTYQARSCNSFNGGYAEIQAPLAAGQKQNQDVYLLKYQPC